MIKKYGIWFLVLIFGLLYSIYSVVRHLRLESFIFDLGVYDQVIWLASRGKPLFSSILESHPWGDHFTPTLLLLAPLYWIWDNVIILLLFQAFFAAFGAYPIYLLALKKTKETWLSLVVAFVYLAFFGIQNAIAFDFHPIVLATTLLAWLFWLYEEKKYRLFWLVLILFVGLQENFLLLAAALGLFLIVRYRDFKRGIILLLVCPVIFLFLILYLIPSLNQAPFIYMPSHFKTLTPLGAAKMFFYPTSKIQVMIVSFLAFGFLPFLTPTIWLMLLEEFIQRFIGTPISTRWNLGFQYNAILAPILAFGAIAAIQKYFLKRKILVAALLLGGFLLIQGLTSPALNDLRLFQFYDLSRTKDSRAILALIPPETSVAATNNLGPQLTHREKIIFLTNCHDNPKIWRVDMKRCFNLKPDYIVADLNPEGNWNNFYPDASRDLLLKYIRYVQETGEYQLVKKQGEAYLLKRSQ